MDKLRTWWTTKAWPFLKRWGWWILAGAVLLLVLPFLGVGWLVDAFRRLRSGEQAMEAEVARARAGELDAQRKVLLRDAAKLRVEDEALREDFIRSHQESVAAKKRIMEMDAEEVAAEFNRFMRERKGTQ